MEVKIIDPRVFINWDESKEHLVRALQSEIPALTGKLSRSAAGISLNVEIDQLIAFGELDIHLYESVDATNNGDVATLLKTAKARNSGRMPKPKGDRCLFPEGAKGGGGSARRRIARRVWI